MTSSSPRRRCEKCGAPFGDRDRVCFACQHPLVLPDIEAASSPTTSTAARPAAAAPVAAGPTERTPAPDHPVILDIQYGHSRQSATVTAARATIGSSADADIRVRAAFLKPIHAVVDFGADGWTMTPAGAGSVVLRDGTAGERVLLAAGETYRIGDGVGNVVTVRPRVDARARLRRSALRTALPARNESFLIGSHASCAVRLDHPLVHRRHAAVRRDGADALWLEDRATSAGTFVNGERLRGRTRLSVGDIIQIGPFSATIGSNALEPLEQLPGVDIDVRDASLTVRDRDRGVQDLMRHVSLHITPASLTAVVGPSGAGKTTLMRMLSGQLATSAGIVSYNGMDIALSRQAYSDLMGFVPQDDIVHAELTVTEALEYQARLRLGSSTTPDDRRARIDRLIAMLGLERQRGQLVRTLSGGQRKRVSIASELLPDPQLLFLDEPTSGLDPGLDKRMMLLLRLLADQGRTIVLTTHAIAHVDVCDTLVLVGPGGHVIYAGPPDGAADWFGIESLADAFAQTETREAAADAARRWTREEAAQARPDVVEATTSAPVRPTRLAIGSTAWRATVLSHARIFAGRQLRLLGRDRTALTYTLLQGVVIALLTVLVAPSHLVWNRNGDTTMFVFGCAAVWFGLIGSVREIVKERTIWRREYLAGGSLPAYLGAKVVLLSALALVQSLTLTIVLALTLGLPGDGPLTSSWLTIALTLWLANVCGLTIGLAISATSATADRALSLVPYLLISQLVLCGVLFHLGAVNFVSWFMPARWSVSSLGGIAGVPGTSAASAGLYRHSTGALLGNWTVLAALAAAAVAATAWSLLRQGRGWRTGADSAPPSRLRAAWQRRRITGLRPAPESA